MTLRVGARERLALPALALCLASCGTLVQRYVVREYMGISFDSKEISTEVRHLALRAQAGDKQAQLELGIRFEEGRGVERDVAKARDMYRLAASDSGGPVWVYVPPTVKGQRGRVMPVAGGRKASGLAEAKARLDALEQVE